MKKKWMCTGVREPKPNSSGFRATVWREQLSCQGVGPQEGTNSSQQIRPGDLPFAAVRTPERSRVLELGEPTVDPRHGSQVQEGDTGTSSTILNSTLGTFRSTKIVTCSVRALSQVEATAGYIGLTPSWCNTVVGMRRGFVVLLRYTNTHTRLCCLTCERSSGCVTRTTDP